MSETKADALKAANAETWRMIHDKEARQAKAHAELDAWLKQQQADKAAADAERHAQRVLDLLDGEAEPIIETERTRYIRDEITLEDFEQRVETILADEPHWWETMQPA